MAGGIILNEIGGIEIRIDIRLHAMRKKLHDLGTALARYGGVDGLASYELIGFSHFNADKDYVELEISDT